MLKKNRFIKFLIARSLILLMGTFSLNAQVKIGPCSRQAVFVTENGVCTPPDMVPVLVFHDEFTGSSLDKSKWLTAPTYHRFGEADYYTDGANYIFDHPGISLVEKNDGIDARGIPYEPDDFIIPKYDGGKNYRHWAYTSGMLYSKYLFGYGIYQITCKFPAGYTFHPNFWQYGQAYDDGGDEIDACEDYCEDIPYHVHFNAQHNGNQCPYDYGDGTDYSAAFHAFTYSWDNYAIAWFIDGNWKAYTTKFFDELGHPIFCNSLSVNANPYELNKEYPLYPMNIYVTCNVGHVGTGVGCNPDESTVFPAQMDVQSVQYYEYLPCSQGPITVDESNLSSLPDFFNVFTASSVTVNGNVSVPNVGALEILATNSITFSAGFASSGYLVAKTEPNPCAGERKISSSDSSKNSILHGNRTDSTQDNFEIYPVPASNLITVSCNLINDEDLIIEIYDLLGHRLCNVLNSYRKAGKFSLPINTNDMANGVYLCKIRAGQNSIEKKLIIAK